MIDYPKVGELWVAKSLVLFEVKEVTEAGVIIQLYHDPQCSYRVGVYEFISKYKKTK